MKYWHVALACTAFLSTGLIVGANWDRWVGEGGDLLPTAEAAGGQVDSPTGIAPDRYVYYPGTEELDPNEVRIIACGTGLPSARRSQAASCFLVELGNGEKFLFDIGTGSMGNIMSLMIPADYLTKIFLSHLHTDHWGDLDALWAGGWTAGRTGPLEVWGPSGAREDMGTAYAIENFLDTYNWDYQTRSAQISPIPGDITVHEFDYKGENEVIYDENGVVVRSWPAIHAGDGAVSLALEWNGYKIVYSGDTAPTQWMMEYAQDADIVIHEAMPMPQVMVEFYNQPPERAIRASCGFHTCPPALGKIFSELQPRHGIAFHFFNDEATRYLQYDGIRQTYDGPLSMATDMMVWNVRRDEIVERMAVSPDDAWDVPGTGRPGAPDPNFPSQYSDFVLDGRLDTSEAESQMREEFNERFGIEE